jgi:hypothetical protein
MSPLLAGFVVTLGHASEVFTKGCLPCLCGGRVMHELFITADCFSSSWMHHWHGKLFEIKTTRGSGWAKICPE